jgi:hypothetical protein
MKVTRSYGLALVLVCLACMTLMIASCGKSDNSSTPAAVYKVEYVPGTGMNAPTEGKTTFQLKITKQSDGSAATGLAPVLTLTMTMSNGDSHSTPIDSVKESASPGTYDCTVYYLMASKMNDGTSMGTWEMKVTVNGETTIFNPDVIMSMDSDTVKATLKGQNDIISGMSGAEKRTYYLFNDGLDSGMGGMYTLKLFITAKESSTSYTALSSATTTTLHDENGVAWSANPVSVEASTDGASWTNGTNSTGGHWSVSLSSGITSSVTNTIYVRLSVGKNGGTAEQKTTDGNAVSGSNGYQTILVTPSSM